ncbi:MAG TPA: c-type cytochrome, partial [Gemmatimonadaceae bacterium]|nr:c-type cytochrome [Gemmatimonadaceae bacterium]
AVPIPTDPAAVARGKHLTEAVGKCQACHGDDYAGKTVFDAPVFLNLTSSNLTSGRGGIGKGYTDEDWVRSIRYGVDRTGKSLLFMPSEAFTHFNDADLGAIIAYLKTLPAADMKVPPKKSVGPIGRMVYLVSDFPLLPATLIDRTHRTAPIAEGVTREYGEYLTKAGGCTSCHGASLSGGGKIDGVVAANLTPAGAVGKWTEADFMRAIRTGQRPDGRVISAVMPWPYMKGLTDDELRAMWLYIHSVPAKKSGEK